MPAGQDTRLRQATLAFRANAWVFALLAAVYLGLTSVGFVLREEREIAEGPPMDICLVFDTTGSMGGEIAGMLRVCRSLALKLALSGIDYRLAMVCFGAREEDAIVRRTMDFTRDVDHVRHFLAQLRAHGGGTEDQIVAMHHALDNLSHRPQARHSFVLISDEPLPPPSATDPGCTELIKRLVGETTQVYVVAVDLPQYRELAAGTDGRFYDIHGRNDFTDILGQVFTDISTSFTR